MEKGWRTLEIMAREFAGQKKQIILFVYPDRYDEEVRAMFIMDIEFWD